MGCDIHGVVQVRYDKDGEYSDAGPIEDSRNYLVFAMLAGVRNSYDIKPISSPRGVPQDFIGDAFNLGDHSFSWVTLTEVIEWPYWEQPGWLPGSTIRESCATFRVWVDWLAMRHSTWLRDDPAAVRLVFGFDS